MNNAHDEYLVTQVLTATPQKLHLMLIEAALRQCERARQSWAAERQDEASAALGKAQEILTQMLASLNYAENPELAGRIAAVYNFIFRSLVTAQVRTSEAALADAVKLLEFERGTWKELVERTSTSQIPPRTHAPHALPAMPKLADAPTSRISFEA